jgi:predicted Zn finger-like uncharacterized protein
MALATQCPHCHTTFRVAADQLKLRGGIVRCGACQRIFDGSAHLIDLDKLAADKAAAPASSATPPTEPPAPEGTRNAEHDALPVYTLDFDHTFDPLGILPKAAPAPDDAQPPASVDTAPAPAGTAPRAHVWRTGGASARAPEAAETQPADADATETMPAVSPVTGDETHAIPLDVQTADAAVADAHVADAQDTDALTSDAQTTDTQASDTAATAEQPAAAPVSAAAYAPVGRVEPRLEPVVDAASGTTADVAAPSVAEPPADAAEAPPAEPAPASAYAPAGRVEPNFGLPVDEEIVAQPLPDYDAEPEPAALTEPEQAAEPMPAPAAPPDTPAAAAAADTPPVFLPLRASAASEPSAPAPAMIPPVQPTRSRAVRASEARARRSKLTPTKIEPPKLRLAPDADADEPEFVKRSRRQERMGRTQRLLMALGAVALLLLLAAQAVLGFRNVLAAQHPAMKPFLQGACAVLGCRVELPAQAENLVIETGELTTLGPGTYALNTLLRNQGNLVLAWPSIELELTDANDKPVLRRVLAPADYLPPGTSAASGFGPHSEQPVTLHFTLAGLQPSGYHTFVFYP